MKNDLSQDQGFIMAALLIEVAHLIAKARQNVLKTYGISLRQSAVLRIIKNIGEEATPSDITKWLPLEFNSVSEILTRMEKKGLVRKSPDLGNKVKIRITLTEKGQQLCDQAIKVDTTYWLKSSLSEEQFQQLKQHLSILRERAIKQIALTGKEFLSKAYEK